MKILQTYQALLLVTFLLIIGLVVRIFQPGNYVFGFDQVQILQKAQEITQKDFTLVGPRTGPADLFTGPLVYYVTAVFFFVMHQSPYALVGLTATLSFATGLSFYLLASRALDKSMAVKLLAVWSCAPFFINFDRIAWNPLLSLLSSALVFFSLVSILKRNKVSWIDVVLIFIGCFLGYQAHFSTLILPVLVGICFLMFKRKYIWLVIVALAGLALSVVPTLLFDLKQNWHNTRGLLSFFTNKDKVESSFDIGRLINDFKISFENIGKVFFSGYDFTFIMLFGFLILIAVGVMIKRNERNRQLLLLSLVWIAFIALSFSFYRETKPEYYYLVQFPAILLLLLEVMKTFLEVKLERALLLFFCAYGVIHSLFLQWDKNEFGLQAQYDAGVSIRSRVESGNISRVRYAMKPIEAQGIEYFAVTTASLNPQGYALNVIYPVASDQLVVAKYGKIGLWEDNKKQTDKNYLTRQSYLIKTPLNISLLEDHYVPEDFEGSTVYRLIKDNTDLGQLLIVISRGDNSNQAFSQIANQVVIDPWKQISVDQYQGKGYFLPEKNLVFVLTEAANGGVQTNELSIE